MNESAWRGPDADTFREQWSGQTADRFDRIGEDLTGRSGDVERRTEQQDDASTAGGEGFGASASSRTPSP